MQNQLNLNFHQTFKPEKQYIVSILNITDMQKPLSIQEISSFTGIPNGKSSGKVEPHITYAKYMGLIDVIKENGNYILSKTRLGEIVTYEDPGLQEKLTILLCHAMMLRKKSGAAMWSAAFNIVLPQYHTGINKEFLIKELDRELGGKVTTKNISPLLSSYEDIFSILNIIEINDSRIIQKKLSIEKEFIYLYALMLLEYWDEIFVEQNEITAEQLVKICFGNSFGWDMEREYQALEYLSDKEIIRLNRQLSPYTILKLVDKDVIIEKLYSELC